MGGDFVLCVEAFSPYQAKLTGPGGVTKLISAAEAYGMICARAVDMMNKGQLPRKER